MVTRRFSMGGEVPSPERNIDNDAPQACGKKSSMLPFTSPNTVAVDRHPRCSTRREPLQGFQSLLVAP